MTRAGIRVALIDLEAQGLVELICNRGSRVRVRVVTVEEAAAAAGDEQLAEPTELGEAMTQAVADGEPLTYSELNQRLHARIREISGQRTAVVLPARLHAQLVRHRFRSALRPGRTQHSLKEYLAMIEALRDTPGGRVRYPGDAEIAGMPGTAAPVVIEFPPGTGPLLIAASSLGVTGYETPAAPEADRALADRVVPHARDAAGRLDAAVASWRPAHQACWSASASAVCCRPRSAWPTRSNCQSPARRRAPPTAGTRCSTCFPGGAWLQTLLYWPASFGGRGAVSLCGPAAWARPAAGNR